ncbi:beach-domain-containing protein [Venturia nashicola]|nr:beach-domain-containing protein [Venturia nashicola]
MNSPLATELQGIVRTIAETCETQRDGVVSVGMLQILCDDLRRIRQLLIDNSDRGHARDDFRRVDGFHTVLQVLSSLSGFYNPNKNSRDERAAFFEVLKADLEVLAEALSDHTGNRRFFTKRVKDGGWKALAERLASSGAVYPHSVEDQGPAQLLGIMLAFALEEESFSAMFRNLDKIERAVDQETKVKEQAAPEQDTPENRNGIESHTSHLQSLRERLQKYFTGKEVLRNPEVVPIMLSFWRHLLPGPYGQAQGQGPKPTGETSAPSHEQTGRTFVGKAKAEQPILAAALILALDLVAQSSIRNSVRTHGSGALSAILPLLFDDQEQTTKISTDVLVALEGLSTRLIPYGTTSLDDARFIFRQSSKSKKAAQFLLGALQKSSPHFIQFDLSTHGYSSIELPTLGHTFPPSSPNAGYTVSAWIRVDKFDADVHTTIFGAYDSTQTSFILVYLEKDARQFILQTSVRARTPSVRFRNVKFKEHEWYHVALVQRRPKIGNTSSASLYVNGQLCERQKVQYPSNAPPINSSTDSFASLSSQTSKYSAIQAFLGTPQDLAPRLGRDVLDSKWSLASFHLFNEPLNDGIIAVHHRLGYGYSGNFQDVLGSFQTYRDSAALSHRNELDNPGKEDQSEIASATKQKASHVLAESRIILSFSPDMVLDNEDHSHVDESRLFGNLSRDAARMLKRILRSGGNAVILNAAVPSINDALTHPNGVAILTGEPVVCVPQALDGACWQLAGSAALGLKLVELARSKDDVLLATQIFFQTLENSWRNSEAVERDGYQVLAGLLREKLGQSSIFADSARTRAHAGPVGPNEREELALEALRMILRFVGYNEEKPEESLLINPLAYRVLLVDFDTWRKTPIATQKLYYSQFMHFTSENSTNHHYNSKRLVRMRVVKRMLDALKGETFSEDLFPDFLEAFSTLLRCNTSAENLRSIALFVTYALQDSRAFSLRTGRFLKNGQRQSGSHTPVGSRTDPFVERSDSPARVLQNVLSSHEVGVRLLHMYTEFLCDTTSLEPIKKFAKTVANKWLMFLLDETDPRIIFMSAKLLAHLLIIHGPHYVRRFGEKNGGFVTLAQKLKMWWNTPAIWTICFALLFGVDPVTIDFEEDFNHFTLADIFSRKSFQVMYPETFPVLTGMLEHGLRAIVQDGHSADPDAELAPNSSNGTGAERSMGRERSMSLTADRYSRGTEKTPVMQIAGDAEVLNTVIRFLTDLHLKYISFRDFEVNSDYVKDLLFVLYPVVVTSDKVSAETELQSRGSALTFEGQDVVIRPHNSSENMRPPIVRTTTVEPPPSPSAQKALPFRRTSSFILVTSDRPEHGPSPARLNTVISPNGTAPVAMRVSNSIVDGLLQVVIAVFLDQILHRKEFPGFGIFLKVPPGFQEHQAYFESYCFDHAMSSLSNELRQNPKLLTEPKVITNVSRYVGHMSEAVFEGWYLDGAEPLLDFIGQAIEQLQKPEVASLKNVRLCSQNIAAMRAIFLRITLLRLQELDETRNDDAVVSFLAKMSYWQTIILTPDDTQIRFLRLVFYLLYIKLVSPIATIRRATTEFWRMLLVQKPEESTLVFTDSVSQEQRYIPNAFMKLSEVDNASFLAWIDSNRQELDQFFFTTLSKDWENFVTEENTKTVETKTMRIAKRKERLKQWYDEEKRFSEIDRKHDTAGPHWRANIHAAERLKHQRALQDQQDNLNFTATTLAKFDRVLKAPCSLFDEQTDPKWRLDETEGEHRMRLRIIPDRIAHLDEYQPKRNTSGMVRKTPPKLNTNLPATTSNELIGMTPTKREDASSPLLLPESGRRRAASENTLGSIPPEDEFELIADPKQDEDGFEDKNRKVMRSLEHGDIIQHVCNVSRIIGLEACEGLFILGKDCLYLIDNYFQRADGEVVGVWQAPSEERDPYLRLLPGNDSKSRKPRFSLTDQTSRRWRWQDVMVISKRKFLFRDVAMEIFFTDGRSYLLTAMSAQNRDDLYNRLVVRAPLLNNPSRLAESEDAWRLESWRNPEEAPQSLSSNFSRLFNQGLSNPAMRRWVKGEMSNFHYLMLVNTMAGRSFNDLTQYPVFPWVLADYTSDELDLSKPETFRDFSRPMAVQSPSQERQLKERYEALASLEDDSDHAPGPFHYGTHYSSSSVVSNYMVRLQPFVQSHLSLQGGYFDHPDRLFYSIEKAWDSASRGLLGDVRELTPEFFYLPDFLVNGNNFNFGLTQRGHAIDNVELPPWAKGDPEIFIAKHREALESPFVSMHIHKWIDLIFGFKQRGEPAKESFNVFHPYSYHGAIDLEAISDEIERQQMINIIHSFGQTPHQVFTRQHAQREGTHHRFPGLDNSAEYLMGQNTLFQLPDRIATMTWSAKHERLICSGPFRLHVPPVFDKYVEWGFCDGSLRFFSTDGRKQLAMFEHLHIGSIASACFVDSRTLVTAGADSVVSIWNVEYTNRTVNVVLRTSLFGHRQPVNVLTASNRFMTLLSADISGRVLMWDLNRNDFVREIEKEGPEVRSVKISSGTGDVLLSRGRSIKILTINGKHLLERDICDEHEPGDEVTSIAWYQAVKQEWMERILFLTGHRSGIVKIWQKLISPSGEWALKLIKGLEQPPAPENQGRIAVTCLLPVGDRLFGGDDIGRVHEWQCAKHD